MKDKEHGQLASLTQTRDTLVKLRTALKNKINNILSARGLNLAKEALSSEKKLDEVLELPFDEMVRIELRVIVEQIRSLNQSIAELEKTIGEEGSKLEGHKNLTSIKGIGKITGRDSAERDRRCERLRRRGPSGELLRHRAAGIELERNRTQRPDSQTRHASWDGRRWCNRR